MRTNMRTQMRTFNPRSGAEIVRASDGQLGELSPDFGPGEFVRLPGGAIAMIENRLGPSRLRIKFGADGPLEEVRSRGVRWATREEIREAGFEGVGHCTPEVAK